MAEKKTIAYWSILLAVVLAAGAILSVNSTQARYVSSTMWNTIALPGEETVTSDCLRSASDAPMTVLLGEISPEGQKKAQRHQADFCMESTKDVAGALTWSVDKPEYLRAAMYMGAVELQQGSEVALKEKEPVTVIMYLTATDAAGSQSHEAMTVKVNVSWGDSLQGAFAIDLAEVIMQEPVLPEENPDTQEPTNPEGTEPSEGEGANSDETESSEGEGTNSDETESSEGEETNSDETEPSEGEGTNSDETESSEGEGTNSDETEPSEGEGTNSDETESSEGEGTNPDETEPSEGEGTNSDETESSEGEGTNPDETESSKGEGTNPEGTEPPEGETETGNTTEPPTEDPVQDPDNEGFVQIKTIKGFTKDAMLQITVETDNQADSLALGMVSQDGTQQIGFPGKTCYSLDHGNSYYMLYHGGQIRLTVKESHNVLIDFSRTVLQDGVLNLQLNAYKNDVLHASAQTSTEISTEALYQMDSPILKDKETLKIVLNSQWTDYPVACSMEKITTVTSEQGDFTQRMEIDPVLAGFEITVTEDPEGDIVAVTGAKQRPAAGSYVLHLQWSDDGMGIGQTEIPFFVNYYPDIQPKTESETETTGGAEQ